MSGPAPILRGRIPGWKRPDPGQLVRWGRQEWIQFGLDFDHSLSLPPDLFLGLLKGSPKPGCFGQDRLCALERRIVLDAHDDTNQPVFDPDAARMKAVP